MRFLYFLSKTDRKVIKDCPAFTKGIQASLGFFVLLTGVLALVSGTYAISNMFVHENPATKVPEMAPDGWLFALLLGSIYSIMIMAIDREIVSAGSKIAVILRIPLAIVISLIISVPMELQLLESAITKELRTQTSRNSDSVRVMYSSEERLAPLENDISRLDSLKRLAETERTYWSRIMQQESLGVINAGVTTGKAGEGDSYRQAQRLKGEFDTLLLKYEAELAVKQRALDAARGRRDQNAAIAYVPQAYDLLTRYVALQQVKTSDSSGSAGRMGMGITILFLLFELIPSIVKILLPKTEYDEMIDRRRRLNIYAIRLIYESAHAEYEGQSVEEITAANPVTIEKMHNALNRKNEHPEEYVMESA
jgi:hypothetical protein